MVGRDTKIDKLWFMVTLSIIINIVCHSSAHIIEEYFIKKS